MKNKKGQGSGMEVSVLIILIAMFILIYVILLPPAEREELLNDTLSTAEVGGPTEKVILSESPGMIYRQTKAVQESNLEPMHFYVKSDKQTQTIAKSLSVSKNLLQDNYKDIYFTVDDKKNLIKASLIFFIKEHEGDLRVELNGRTIFEGEMTSNDLPLALPTEYIKEGENKLTLSTSSPGIKIFSAHYYLLREVSIIKEIRVENSKAKRYFNIDSNQKVRRVQLSYFVSCNSDQEGRLKIKVNKKQVLDDSIFCEYPDRREIPIPKDAIRSGSNEVTFEIDKGDYNIDKATIEVHLSKSSYPSYVFDVNSALYSALTSEAKKLMIRFEFKSEGRKKAAISIQGNEFSIDTYSGSYEKDITSMIDNGANYIKIIPKSDFEISNFKIYVK